MNRLWPRSRLLLLAICCVASLWSVGSTRVRADDSDAQYKTTIDEAVREFGLGNWAEARALFRRAHGQSPNARTWRGMGMAAFELKDYVDALRELSAALADKERPLTDDLRKQTQKLMDQSKAFVGRYQVVLEPAQAQPWVDGAQPVFDSGNVLLLGLGDHTVSATAEGYQEVRVPLRVEGGEDMVLRITLQPAVAAGQPGPAPAPVAAPGATAATIPPPTAAAPVAAVATENAESHGLRTAAWITLGGAALLGVGSAVFWAAGESKYKQLEKGCGSQVGGCSQAQIDASGVKGADTMTSVFLGLSAAAAATSIVLFIVNAGHGSSDSEKTARASAPELRIGPGYAQLQGSF